MLAVSILILFVLSFQVMPVALGMDFRKDVLFQTLGGIVFLTLGQMLLFLLGIGLGNSFMHLLEGVKRYVLFMGFFLISVRYGMEAFKVRKGERTYMAEKSSTYILPAIAQGVNTFLAGILFYFLPVALSRDLAYLALFSFSFALLFALLKNKKLAFPAVSLLYLIGSAVLALLSFYFLFI